MNYSKTAADIVRKVGGKSNIRSATHCMTRLRLYLADESKAADADVEAIDGVLRVIRQGGQYQIVIGNEVPKVFREITALGVSGENADPSKEEAKKKSEESLLSRLLGFVAGSMTPLLPAMLGGGMVKVILTLLVNFKLIAEGSSTYEILNVVGDAFFYFLPIMLAATVAKKIGSSQMLAMLVAGILLHPNLTALFSEGGGSFFGIPVHSANYASSVLPIFLIVPVMKYIEIFADRITPSLVKVFVKPLIVLLISAPLALIVIGPIGSILGDYLADGVNFLYDKAGWLTILLLSALMPFIVMTGMHYALIPLATISLSTLGYDPVLTATMFCSNLAQGGASLAVSLKSRDKNMRQIALGSGVSAIIAGVTEPALYGVTMKLKKPLIAAVIAAGVGGLYAGLTGVVAYTLGGSPSAISLVTMIGGEGYRTLINGVITLVIVLALSFGLTLILYRGKERKSDPAVESVGAGASGSGNANEGGMNAIQTRSDGESGTTDAAITVRCPIAGKVIPLSEVKDATFASGVLGKGCAVDPYEGHVYAPFSGKVDNLFDTLHAVSLISDDGVELLIHIGRDTVELGGKHFKAYCKAGDTFKTGDLLIDFDLDAIGKAGYDTVTPIIVANSDRYESIATAADGKCAVGDGMLTLIPKKSKEK